MWCNHLLNIIETNDKYSECENILLKPLALDLIDNIYTGCPVFTAIYDLPLRGT